MPSTMGAKREPLSWGWRTSLYAFARWSTKRDPQMLRILLSSSRFRARYDAAKHTSVRVEEREC